MSNVERLEQEIKKLSPEELNIFRRWFAIFDAEAWDKQIERDAQSGSLDRLAEAALTALKNGKATEF